MTGLAHKYIILLIPSPEVLLLNSITSQDIKAALGTRFLGKIVASYESLPSTMDEAHRLAREGAPEGALVLAEEQTAGRGRFQRQWVSPKGQNLYLSLILRPSPHELTRLNMASSLAVARAIKRTTGLEATIKWPNDVRLGGKKVCGILIEGSQGDNGYAVVGIGININLDPTPYPEIAAIATSLARELGRAVSRLEVLRVFLEEMERLILQVRQGGSPVSEWRKHLDTLGKKVRVKWGEQVQEGYAEDVDDEGDLLLRLPDGSVSTVLAGEVTLQV